MEMSWQVKEKPPENPAGDDESPWNIDPAMEKGFQVRDLMRFFTVDIILIVLLKLLLGLGFFATPDHYVLAVIGSKVVLFAYLMWLIKDRRDAWPETGAAARGPWWAWAGMIALYAGHFLASPWIDRFNINLMRQLYEAFDWAYVPAPQDIVVLIFEDIVNLPTRLALVFLTVFAGPFMEELAFRGVGLDGFKRSFNTFWAVVWISLLFGLYHFSLPLLLPLSLLGVLFAVVRLVSGSLWCAVAMHCLHNGLALAITAHRLGVFDSWLSHWR